MASVTPETAKKEKRLTGVYALIPAAGRGVRFGSFENKVFASLLGRPLLGWTLQPFVLDQHVDGIVLIGSESDLPRLQLLAEQYGGGKTIVVIGGETRQESVRRGLEVVPETVDYVLVHDAARPCVTETHITTSIRWLEKYDAISWAIPITDTLVRAERTDGDNAEMGKYVRREGLWAVQTPQAFRRSDLVQAHERAAAEGFVGTDDAGLVRRLGLSVQLAPGSMENIKVTRSGDLELARAILLARMVSPTDNNSRVYAEESPSYIAETFPVTPKQTLPTSRTSPPFRIGHGYDVHPFSPERPMWLGGVHFPESPQGLLGHSDADALLHAVCDALLGAAGLGDIGKLFPPSDERHKDRPSIQFLEEVKSQLDEMDWRVANLDITVIAEYPKIGPRSEAIKQKIAVCLDVDAAQISVKATTNEQMGFVGRGEGIAVHATALLFR